MGYTGSFRQDIFTRVVEEGLIVEESNRRYTDDEVSAIIRRALGHRGPRDTISHDELVDIARSSGIGAEQLEAALHEQESEGEIEAARHEWVRRHRAEFYNHLTSYCIVNGFLVFVYLMTSRGYFWVIWPMMGWGIGMAFHFRKAFFATDATIERGARKILRKRRRRLEWLREHERG